MMMEEAGYNPFVEGDGDVMKDVPPERTGGHSFLESDFSYGAHGRRLSFAEATVPTIATLNSSTSSLSPSHSPSTPTPLRVSSKHIRASSNSSSSSSPGPALRIVVDNDSEEDKKQDSLENPFVNEPISLDSPPSTSATSSSPSLSTSTSITPSSPLGKSSENKLFIAVSPLVTPRNDGRVPGSPRLPSSPLASSNGAPKGDPRALFTYQSLPAARSSVVTVEKAEWVPDSSSLVCEHCSDEFTFIRRRHHCRVCGHLFCGECMVKATLPATLGFNAAQKTCVRCAYRVIRMRGHFSTTIKVDNDLSIGQKLSGKMQNFVYKVSGMHEGGKFDRFAATIATPRQFSMYQTDVLELSIPSHHDASNVPAHAYIPKGDGPYSVLVYIPGGSFVLETETGIATFCKELCCKVGCIVVSVGYRLAPEYKFPTQWEDCYSVVKWLYESSALDLPKLEKDPKIAVCGEGSGGLLAAAVCQMARDRGSPPIRYQLLITPWLNLTTLNVEKFDNSYVLTKDLMKWVLKQLFNDYGERDKQYVSPSLTSSLANLPPAKILTAGYDPLRYDAEEYANEMRKEDVNVSVTRYENSMHGFVGNYADSHDELEEAVYECVVCLREVFGRGEPLGANKNHPLDSGSF